MIFESATTDRLLNKLKNRDHIIWDWNGTLLSDVDHAVETVNILLKRHALPLLDRERYKLAFDFPIRNYYETLGFDFNKLNFDEICHHFVDHFMAGIHKLPLVRGMEDILRRLHKEGTQQSVLSAADQVSLDHMVGHFGLRDVFSHVYGIQSKRADSKVERGRELMSVSQVPPEKTVMVGDTLHDLEVGEALGIDVILVGHGHQCATRLRRAHHDVVEE